MPAAIEVDDCSELIRRTGLNELNLVYFGDLEGDLWNAFKRAGKSPLISKKYMFYNTLNPMCIIEILGIEVIQQSTESSFLALTRSFDESPLVYEGEYTQNALVKFAKKHELPMVIELREKMVDLLFSGELPSVFFFVANKA